MKYRRHLFASIAAAVGLFATTSALHAEEAKPAEGADKAPAVHTKSLWEKIYEGGWVMFPIGACSVFTMYLVVDCSVRTGRKKVLPPQHVEAVKGYFRQGDYIGAYNYCKKSPSPFTNVCRVAVSMLGEGKTGVEEGMVAELSKENAAMQTQISYLSVIGVCTPMIGLVGTVTGMIKAFEHLGASGIGDPSGLSSAIGEVLVATASGLFIAIPAFGSYYFLRNRAGKALHDIQDTMAFLFRKMPYEDFAGVHIGDDEVVAARPSWATEAQEEALTA
jgi:biopolymer transport protein ExbB